MKKSLLIVSLMMFFSLAASAADSIYNFTLRDNSGNPYCNIAYLRLYKPSGVPKVVVAGYYYNALCDGNIYPGSGFKHGLSPTLQGGGTTGPVLDMSTVAYWNNEGNNTQLLVNTKFNRWTLYQSNDFNTNVFINSGTYVNGTASEAKGTKDAAQR